MDMSMTFSLMLPPDQAGSQGFGRRYSPREWEEVKSLIEDWYVDQGFKMKEVVEALAGINFLVTEKQVKDRLNKWNLNIKNVNENNMFAIARSRVKRREIVGKESTFRIGKPGNKREVKHTDINRFLKRKNISEMSLLEMESPVNATSPAFSVYTPLVPPTPGTLPSSPRILQSPDMTMATTAFVPRSPFPPSMLSPALVPPSPAPSLSWVFTASTPFEGQSPAELSSEVSHDRDNATLESFRSLPFALGMGPDEESRPWFRELIPTLVEIGSLGPFRAMAGDAIPINSQHSLLYEAGIDVNIDEAGGAATIMTDIEISSTNEPLVEQSLPNGRTRYLQEEENRLREVVANVEREYAPHHDNTYAAKRDLSVVLVRQGRYKSAESLLLNVLETQRKSSCSNHLEECSTLEMLGHVLNQQGRFDASERLLRIVVRTRSKTQGLDHEGTQYARSLLADVLVAQSRHTEARGINEEILAYYQKVWGPDHPNTLRAMISHTRSLWFQDRQGAIAMLQQVLAVQKRTLGERHEETLVTKQYLSFHLIQAEQLGRAETLIDEALPATRGVFGTEHPVTLILEYYRCHLFQKQRRLEEAEIILLRTMESMAKILGARHPQTIRTKRLMAQIMQDRGRFDEAVTLFEEVVPLYSQVLGAQHPETVDVRKKLEEMSANLALKRRLFANVNHQMYC